ncbi:hypothetical protein Ahy_A06g028219 [Arachis hypogaea]|uniref:Uncharacterized protein n=1 Tax=Arachis hypogaea TaxID=3818 RepID=A0A445CQK0_ARAHY|nr:hypothetical protein Ahy_A06g028219 [Arachis hypogaea]
MTGFVYQFIRVYQLKILSVGITFGSLTILRYKDQFKEAVFLAFDSPSWKVNGVADHVLRSLLGSQVHYYPIDQYRYVYSWLCEFCCVLLGCVCEF